MNNNQKADKYNDLLRQYDRLEEKIADIRSEAAGMDLNSEQSAKVRELEKEKEKVIAETRALFG